MKYWSGIVTFLYGLTLVLLTAPLLYLSFFGEIHFREIFKVYLLWPYWIGILLLVIFQWIFLILPVNLANKRPVSKTKIILPIITSGLMIGLLAYGLLLAIDETIYQSNSGEHGNILMLAFGLLIFTWFIWFIIFYRFSKKPNLNF